MRSVCVYINTYAVHTSARTFVLSMRMHVHWCTECYGNLEFGAQYDSRVSARAILIRSRLITSDKIFKSLALAFEERNFHNMLICLHFFFTEHISRITLLIKSLPVVTLSSSSDR